MADHRYSTHHRPTLDDLAPENVTTEALVERVRHHRAGEAYPTAEVLLGNLPKVLRVLCDHVLTGQATPLDVAYRLASIIDVIENVAPDPTRTDFSPSRRH